MSDLFDEWGLFSRIIANNYMRHCDLSMVIRDFLARRVRPCRVADLGCGDGWMARECLRSSRVLRYVGIDTSADALTRVRGCPPPGSDPENVQIDLCRDDVLTSLPSLPDGEFDLVLSSYCLHHFSQPQKQAVLRQIRRVLAPGGTFIWTDLVRQTQQTRDTYLELLVHDMRAIGPPCAPTKSRRPSLTSRAGIIPRKNSGCSTRPANLASRWLVLCCATNFTDHGRSWRHPENQEEGNHPALWSIAMKKPSVLAGTEEVDGLARRIDPAKPAFG